jgi:hypothetical protein
MGEAKELAGLKRPCRTVGLSLRWVKYELQVQIASSTKSTYFSRSSFTGSETAGRNGIYDEPKVRYARHRLLDGYTAFAKEVFYGAARQQ